MGLDNIFVINLARRTERRNRMHYCLNELGLNATFIEATDGRLVIYFQNILNNMHCQYYYFKRQNL